MRRWLLLAWALSTCALSGQTLVPVVAVWDVATSEHHESATWELERDGTIYPCALTSVTETERRCTASVPSGTATFRLRGITTGAGPWSDAVTATVGVSQPGAPPGAFAIQWHRWRDWRAVVPTLEAQVTGFYLDSNQLTLNGVQAGDFLLLQIGTNTNGAPSITGVADNINGAWSAVPCTVEQGFDPSAWIYYRPNSASGNVTVTITGTNVYDAVITLSRWSGMATTDVYDGCDDAITGSATSHPHGSLTTTTAGIIVTALGINDAVGIAGAAGFTWMALPPGESTSSSWLRGWHQYRVTTGAESGVTATITTSVAASSGGVIAAFRAAGGGGGTDYEIEAEPGAYALTGAPAGVLAQRMLDAQPAAYTLSGGIAGLAWGRSLDAESGAYTVTGSPAGAMTALALDAAPGSYTLTGAAAGLSRGYPLHAEAGTYALTGAAAMLSRGLSIEADAGGYAITGAAAMLARGVALDGQPGTYALTGAPAGLSWGAQLAADAGSYVITGADAELVDDTGGGVAYSLDAEPGVYAITGAVAGLVRASSLSADAGSVTVTGAAAGLGYSAALDAQPGAYSLTGAPAATTWGALLAASPGAYVITGAEAGLVSTQDLVATAFTTIRVRPRPHIIRVRSTPTTIRVR